MTRRQNLAAAVASFALALGAGAAAVGGAATRCSIGDERQDR